MFVVGQDTEGCVVKTRECGYVIGALDMSPRLRSVGRGTVYT